MNVRILYAEVLGTFVLMVGGVGAAVLAGSEIGFHGVSIAFGFSLLIMAYTIGPISGCHINPAVTLGMVMAGKTKTSDAPAFIVGQLIGAALGGLAIFVIANGVDLFDATNNFAANGYDEFSPGGYDLLSVAVAEIVVTAIFVVVVVGTTRTDFRAGLRTHRRRPHARARPPRHDPGVEHLGQPGRQLRRRLVRGERRPRAVVGVHRLPADRWRTRRARHAVRRRGTEAGPVAGLVRAVTTRGR